MTPIKPHHVVVVLLFTAAAMLTAWAILSNGLPA